MNRRKTLKELAEKYNTYPDLIRERLKKLEKQLGKKLTTKENGVIKVYIEGEKALDKDIKEHPIRSNKDKKKPIPKKKPTKKNSSPNKLTVSEVSEYEHEQFGKIRVVTIDNEPWFMGVDVAKALGYSNPQEVIRNKVDERDKKIIQTEKNAQLEKSFSNRGAIFINESGLYSLVMASKLKSAREFQHWVTSEVLPQIRETGSYNGNSNLPNNQTIELDQQNLQYIIQNAVQTGIQLAIQPYIAENTFLRADNDQLALERDVYAEDSYEWRKKAEKEHQIAIDVDHINSDLIDENAALKDELGAQGYYLGMSRNEMTTREMAKMLGFRSERVLYPILVNDLKIIYLVERDNERYYLPYSKYVEAGYVYPRRESNHGYSYRVLKWTEKGFKFVYKALVEKGYIEPGKGPKQ